MFTKEELPFSFPSKCQERKAGLLAKDWPQGLVARSSQQSSRGGLCPAVLIEAAEQSGVDRGLSSSAGTAFLSIVSLPPEPRAAHMALLIIQHPFANPLHLLLVQQQDMLRSSF